MIKNIYLLRSTSKKTCSFIQDYPEDSESIMGMSRDNRWHSFGKQYREIKLELCKNDLGKKNYQCDFSGALNPFFVISEQALDKLGDILKPRGEILSVVTESKKKKFFGYYPTNSLEGCFDKKLSIYREYPNGLMIEKPVLIAKNISDEYIFSIEEDISRVFVTDKFKQRVEEAGLLGFDFSIEVPTSA